MYSVLLSIGVGLVVLLAVGAWLGPVTGILPGLVVAMTVFLLLMWQLGKRVQVELERCPDAPAPHAVELLAVVPADDPSDVRITSLVTLRDGRDGDLVEGDGIIDVAIANPLLLTVPPETDILLRFTPRSTASRGCAGEDLEIPYRTGPFRSMD